MNGREAKKARKAQRVHWREYLKIMKKLNFGNRVLLAWWLIWGDVRKIG